LHRLRQITQQRLSVTVGGPFCFSQVATKDGCLTLRDVRSVAATDFDRARSQGNRRRTSVSRPYINLCSTLKRFDESMIAIA
jgi:hypothetical protein